MSLTACKEKKTTQSANESLMESFETVDGTEDPDTTTPSAPKETVNNPAAQYVKDKVNTLKLTDEDGEEVEVEFHFPELQIKSAYAESVNKEISQAGEKYMKDLTNEDAMHFYSTAYIPYLTKDGILSLVFIAYEETDLNEYKVYNIDTKTGERVENARIAQAAGVSDIRKTAMDALQNWYNNMEIVKVKDYKVVLENGEKMDEQMKEVESTFSEKYLNDKMQIGLTNEGKMFFITTVCTMGGADLYSWVFDVSGNTLDDEENPYWIGDSSEDEGEEDDEDYDGDEGLPEIDDDYEQ